MTVAARQRIPGPVLFLDIDGVMNTTDSIVRNKSNRIFTPESVRCLQKIVTETGCKIVISSTWREEDQWKILPQVFTDNGLASVLDRIIDRTPILPAEDGPTREDEIDCWLAAQDYAGPYAILDDIPFDGEHACRLVRTSTDTGLTATECRRAIDILLNG
jgi:hypothetical protein